MAGGGFQITILFGAVTAVEVYARILETIDQADQIYKDSNFWYGVLPKKLASPWKFPALRDNRGAYDVTRSSAPPASGYSTVEGSTTIRTNLEESLRKCLLYDPCTQTGDLSLDAAGQGGYQGHGEPPASRSSSTQSTSATGGIPTDYAMPNRISENAKKNLYTYCRAETEILGPAHRIQLPRAAAKYSAGQDTCFVAAVALPVCRKVIKLDAERVGAWPEVPKGDDTIKDGAMTGTLLRTNVRAHPPVPTPDGRDLIYRLAVEHVYAMNRMPGQSDPMDVGCTPVVSREGSGAYASKLNPKTFV
jgi:hypothetical protein